MILTGLCRLGRDAELKFTANDQPVANLSLAFNYGRAVEGQRPTQWIDAALFGERAKVLAQYLTKGTAICVTLDNPHIETYQKKDGTTGSKLVAMVGSLEFAGSRGDAEPRQEAPKPAAKPTLPGGIQDLNEDIPFDLPYRGRIAYIV